MRGTEGNRGILLRALGTPAQQERMAGNKNSLAITLIEVPPYGVAPVSPRSLCTHGRLAEAKEWFITTAVVALLVKTTVKAVWEASAPELGTVLKEIAKSDTTVRKVRPRGSIATLTSMLLIKKGGGAYD